MMMKALLALVAALLGVYVGARLVVDMRAEPAERALGACEGELQIASFRLSEAEANPALCWVLEGGRSYKASTPSRINAEGCTRAGDEIRLLCPAARFDGEFVGTLTFSRPPP